MKCFCCGGCAHLATGHALSDTAVLCGPCARDFYRWYRERMNRQNWRKGMDSWNEAAAKSIRLEPDKKVRK